MLDARACGHCLRTDPGALGLPMLAAEDWARRQGCGLITLEVFASNTVARAVYERLGYAEQTLKLAKQLHSPATGAEKGR